MSKSMKITFALILLGLVILSTRFYFAGIPPDRDEGLYACMATGLNEGMLPYRDIFDHKQPGIYLFYNLSFKLFGPGFVSVRIFTAFYVLLAMLVIFFAARAASGDKAGLTAAFIFTVLQSSVMLHSVNSNTEIFLSLPLALSMFFWAADIKKTVLKYFLSGAFLAMAFLIKETVIPVLFFVPVYMIACKRKGADWLSYLGGFFAVILSTLLFIASLGIFPEYFEATVLYNLAYAVSSKTGSPGINSDFVLQYFIILAVAMIPLFYFSKKDDRFTPLSLIVYAAGILTGIALQRGIHPHYYTALLPVAAVAAGVGTVLFEPAAKKIKKYGVFLMPAVLVLFTILFISMNLRFYGMTPLDVSAAQFKTSSFGEAAIISAKINELKEPGDRVFVWNAEPEIYYMTNTRPPGSIYYVLPAYIDYDALGVRKMIETVFADAPRFVVTTIHDNPMISVHMKGYELIIQGRELLCWRLRGK